MVQEKLIVMTEKELSRYEIIKRLIRKEINGTDAAKQLSLSLRQVKNIKARVIKEGAKGVIHAGRGKKSNRCLPTEKIKEIKTIIKKNYQDFGPTFAAEKLLEDHQIIISKEKLRKLMTEWSLWKPKPRRRVKHKHLWRPRKNNLGEMEQFDGSYHRWFGKEESCLLLAVDDATGRITHARFDYNEGVVAVFKFWTEYFPKNGLPISIYLDKFSTYKVNHRNAVDNKDLITQFERAAKEIGIKLITANSPQAKGRVERMNKTLQDRLVKELGLAKIITIEGANKFLEGYTPRFNSRFAVVPGRRANLHRPLNEAVKARLPQVFSIQKKRVVCNDYTVRFDNKYYQLSDSQPCTVYKKDVVIIEEHLDGEIKINYKNKYLNYTELPERPKKEIDVKLIALTSERPIQWKPPADHPWRRFVIPSKAKVEQAVSSN